MPYKNQEDANAAQRRRTKRLNDEGLTSRGGQKVRFTKAPVSDAELEKRMVEWTKKHQLRGAYHLRERT